jgi:hypothetical protein
VYNYNWRGGKLYGDYKTNYQGNTYTSAYCKICGARQTGTTCTFCGGDKRKRSNKCFLCKNWDVDGLNIACDYCVDDSMYEHYQSDTTRCGKCCFYDRETVACGVTGYVRDAEDICDCPKSRKEMEVYYNE